MMIYSQVSGWKGKKKVDDIHLSPLLRRSHTLNILRPPHLNDQVMSSGCWKEGRDRQVDQREEP